ncbi:hypothetical protein S83_066946, partial [Arachis hypogaea]
MSPSLEPRSLSPFCLPLSRQYHHILPIRHTHRQRSFYCRHRRKGVAAAVMAVFLAARWRKGQYSPEEVAGAVENGIDKRIVCVTYGGTTAPLEQRSFLKARYAVIFLYRRNFSAILWIPDDPLLNFFEATEGLNIQVREIYSKAVKTAIVDHHAVVDSGLLLKLSFSTIFEYLQ